jgi:hypothetical protein
MRQPETRRERELATAISGKGMAILESGKAWQDGILSFPTYGDLTQREQEFIDGLLTDWQQRITRGR